MLNTAPLTNLAKAGTEETPTATIKLNKSGLTNLIEECYRNESWIGGEFPTHNLANFKTNYCYDDTYTTIYLIYFADTTNIIKMKEQCRSLFNIGKHS